MGIPNHKTTAFPYQAAAVTASDSTEFDEPSTIYVGGAGDVAVVPWIGDGTAVTFAGLSAGQVVPVRVKKCMSTNTTATSLVRVF